MNKNGIKTKQKQNSISEYRFISIAKSAQGRLLVVSYTERQKHTIRIISARPATKQEKNYYENNNSN